MQVSIDLGHADRSDGINLGFLYNERAAEYQNAGAFGEAVADFILAQRIRREVSWPS